MKILHVMLLVLNIMVPVPTVQFNFPVYSGVCCTRFFGLFFTCTGTSRSSRITYNLTWFLIFSGLFRFYIVYTIIIKINENGRGIGFFFLFFFNGIFLSFITEGRWSGIDQILETCGSQPGSVQS
jgi:hypothetical protein